MQLGGQNRIQRNRSTFADSLSPIEPKMQLGGMQQPQQPQQQPFRPKYDMSDPRSATPVGRSRHDPARIMERQLRAESRRLDRELSPFTYEQPQRMARNSVMGAMQGQNPPPPIFTRYY